ncbi:hypothetical protein PHAVU_001G066800 [Phaseolus vulgaris]|uniref:Uncharacterized protein n=1 Tax=Phaseolus vulgaris TaxID=3885 RepID=V7CTE2_PHAVU|nr:hypothetical protein PHAVU_001G066800g [Phaseolus vulgaris]ESW33409.1 hypothetical protein PHAVU_001G066800g [Phaseolus vulgaris]
MSTHKPWTNDAVMEVLRCISRYTPPDAAARRTPQAPQQHPRLGPCHPPMKIMCFQFFFLLLSCFMEVQY